MRLLLHRAPIALLLALLLACNDSPSAPTDAPVAAVKCRRYAAALDSTFTLNAAGGPYVTTESATCTFDRTARVLRCTATAAGGGCTSITRTKTYAGVADFVEEAEAVGRERYDLYEIVQSGGCSGGTSRHAYTFDAQRRPVRLQTTNAGFTVDTTFTAWDDRGRPTQETATTEGCQGSVYARTYDDAARTVTSRTVSPGSGPSCSGGDSRLVVAYDGDGNQVNEAWSGGSTSYTTRSVVVSTASVCL